MGRALALPQLALHGGQLTLQRLRLIPVLAGLVLQLLDVLVHLMAVIASEHHVEYPREWLPGDVTGLGITPGIHALNPPNHPSETGETSADAPVCPPFSPASRTSRRVPNNPYLP